jgi:DNA-binding transcriptional regulator PaaX
MQRETKIKIAKIILKCIAVAGVLAVVAVAPNALQAIDLFYDKKKRRYDLYQKRHYIKTALGRLKDKGLIKFEKQNGKTFVRLTSKGEENLLRYQLGELRIEKPKKWDGKWRVIIFDIKEKRRKSRDGLRTELTSLGFKRLQNSVWVYPYDCEEVIILLKSCFYLGKDVLYMVVEKIENDKWLKKEFSLLRDL